MRLGSGRVVDADKVLVAAGPWTPSLVPGWSQRPPIRPVWGVVVTAAVATPPRTVLEELGIDRPGPKPDELFSLVTAGNDTSVGSTFLADEPDPNQRIASILERAARFVPALSEARPICVRACARPVAFDGRPLIGRVSGFEDCLRVCRSRPVGHLDWTRVRPTRHRRHARPWPDRSRAQRITTLTGQRQSQQPGRASATRECCGSERPGQTRLVV